MLAQNAPQSSKIVALDEMITFCLDKHAPEFQTTISKIRESEHGTNKDQTVDSFTDNVGSLFDVLSNIRRVKIKESSSGSFLFEELEVSFSSAGAEEEKTITGSQYEPN